MNVSIRSVSAAVLLACAVSSPARADWAQSTEVLAVTPTPSNLRVQAQNPPTFAWSRYSATTPVSYVIEVRTGTTVYKTFTSDRNWYLPSQALPEGTYTWRVRPATSTDWSAERSFVITAASVKFEVPEDATIIANVKNKARPRGLQTGLPVYSAWPADLRAERGQYMTWMINEVVRLMTELAPVSDANWPLKTGTVQTAENAAQNSLVRSQINKATRQLEASALLYRLTKETRYLTEAVRRGDELAALDPTGPTSYVNQDQAARQITTGLMKAIDLLAGDLDETRRSRWLGIVTVRGNEIYTQLQKGGARLDQYPFESHAVTNIGFLALISALGVGEIPDAEKWFKFCFRYYVSSLSPWSGAEGGFANGTAYAEYALDYNIQIWQQLGRATGVDLFKKPWSAGFLRFFQQFVPPGSKTHLFGDGQETAPVLKFMKAFALRFATPEAAWYANNLSGNEDPLSYLQGPYPMPARTVATPKPPPNAALFGTIGWAAFHSDMADANRTSVYFKSSPYGSFNHSHGDQNGFVLKKGATPLIVAAGWYDWYDSPLWNNWYRQTKAANGITYNGGIGQNVTGYAETMARNGRIISYSSSPRMEYVAGDATPAYAGALSNAIRRLWYLRASDVVVIHDKLSSSTAKTFEWNMHAQAPITVSGNNLTVTKDGKSVCIRPILTSNLRFEKRAGSTPMAGIYEEHGTYVKTVAATSDEFLVVLDVGCKNTPITWSDTSSGRVLTVGRDSMTIPR
ncbi:heparinase [Massilia sp. YMA4]|nr:heparinase [Massilia sp. YMA4]